MRQYRSNLDDSQDDVLAYMDDQGYTDFRDCPDHALAILRFAENYRHRELWTDAFVHCTGMNDRLFSSREFEVGIEVSNGLINALLTWCVGHLKGFLSADHPCPCRDASPH